MSQEKICYWGPCQKQEFESKEALYHHVETTHLKPPFVCQWDHCQYSCGNHKHDFRRHLKMHTGQKQYVCETCQAAFCRKFVLKQHMRRHNQEKPYSCPVCRMQFAFHSLLWRHQYTHNESPYACLKCDAVFTSAYVLNRHILRKHTGPWCVTCGESYVPQADMICGRCNMHSTFGVKERRFFDFVYNFDPRLAECCFTLRDQPMGCGVRKRPDGLMQLQTKATCVKIESGMETILQEDKYSVKLILEADEYFHAAYDPSCELARLQAIQERDHDALYVLRYNLDQPNAFDESQLAAFCQRVLTVLNGEFLKAVEAPTLFVIEYFGYPEKREQLLNTELERQCTAL